MVAFEKVERCLSTASTGSSLGGMVLRGLGDGRLMMYMHRVVALFDVMVASMAGLARVFASFYLLKTGWRKRAEATSGACTQGAISLVDHWADDGCGWGTSPVVLYGLC